AAGALALIWTTTPWTLPSNLAAAVNPEVDYVVVRGPEGTPLAGERFVLAEARLSHYARELGADAADRVEARLRGAELVGDRYTPVFDFFAGRPNAHQLLAGEFVTTDDGTGIVHMA